MMAGQELVPHRAEAFVHFHKSYLIRLGDMNMNSPLLAGSCRCLGWLRCTYSKYKNTLTVSAKVQLQVWVNQSNEYSITKTVVHAEAMYKIQVISINYESGSF